MNITSVARVCHEVNRAYCEFLGDPSQVPWDEAPQWQKDSATKGVLFHLDGDHDPSESHESWLSVKVEEGWKYGPVKDADKKEHPCMVPYDQLPKEQQIKDHLFRAVVHSMRRVAQNTVAKQASVVELREEVERLKSILDRIGVVAGEAMSNSGHDLAALQEIFNIVRQGEES